MKPGELFDGRYRVEAPIGRGTVHDVYRVIDERDGSRVALKIGRPTRNQGDSYSLRQILADYHCRRHIADPRVARAHRLVTTRLSFQVSELVPVCDVLGLLAQGRLPTRDEAAAFVRGYTQLYSDLEATGMYPLDLEAKNACFPIDQPYMTPRLVDFGTVFMAENVRWALAPHFGDLFIMPHQKPPRLFHRFAELLFVGCLGFEPWGKLARTLPKSRRYTLPAANARACRPELGEVGDWLNQAAEHRVSWTIHDFASFLGLPPARSLFSSPTLDVIGPLARVRAFFDAPATATLSLPDEATAESLAVAMSHAGVAFWRMTAGAECHEVLGAIPNSLPLLLAHHGGPPRVPTVVFAPNLAYAGVDLTELMSGAPVLIIAVGGE